MARGGKLPGGKTRQQVRRAASAAGSATAVIERSVAERAVRAAKMPATSRRSAPVRSGPAAWDDFCQWVDRFQRWSDYEANGREEALDAAHAMGYVEQYIRAQNPDWVAIFEEAFSHHQKVLGHHQVRQLLAWAKRDPENARQVVADLLHDYQTDVFTRIDRFCAAVGEEGMSGIGSRISCASMLLMGAKPDSPIPVYMTGAAKAAQNLCGYETEKRGMSPGERYRHYLGYLDRLMVESNRRGVKMDDRLDAYAAMLWVGKGDTWIQKGWGPSHWGDVQTGAFLHYRTTGEQLI